MTTPPLVLSKVDNSNTYWPAIVNEIQYNFKIFRDYIQNIENIHESHQDIRYLDIVQNMEKIRSRPIEYLDYTLKELLEKRFRIQLCNKVLCWYLISLNSLIEDYRQKRINDLQLSYNIFLPHAQRKAAKAYQDVLRYQQQDDTDPTFNNIFGI